MGEATAWTIAATHVILGSQRLAKESGRSAFVDHATGLGADLVALVRLYDMEVITEAEMECHYKTPLEALCIGADNLDNWRYDVVPEILRYLFHDFEIEGWRLHQHDVHSPTLCMVCLGQFARQWPLDANIVLSATTIQGTDLSSSSFPSPHVVIAPRLENMTIQHCDMHLMFSTASNVKLGSKNDCRSNFNIFIVPTRNEILSPTTKTAIYWPIPSRSRIRTERLDLLTDRRTPTTMAAEEETKKKAPPASWALCSDHLDVQNHQEITTTTPTNGKFTLYAKAVFNIRHLIMMICN